jgi:hypothetical protein
MGEYNGDGIADVVTLLQRTGVESCVFPQMDLLRDLFETGLAKPLNTNWNRSVVVGRFVTTHRDAMFARLRVNPRVSGLPDNQCTFNDWVIDDADGIPVACPAPPYTAVGARDLNGDGFSGIFFRDPASGRNWVWFIRAGAIVGEQAWPAVDPAWALGAIGDTSGRGTTDLVWQHASGFLTRQRVTNRTIVGEDALAALTPDWVVESSGDYDGDGMRDLVIRNVATTELAVLFLDGNGVRNSALLPHPQDDVRYVWRPMPAR